MAKILLQPYKGASKKVDLTNIDAIQKAVEECNSAFNASQPKKGGVALAIHHAQVSNNPVNLFSVLPNIFPDNDMVICNPKILAKDEKYTASEGCMSFPHRGDKKISRYNKIVVEYYVIQVNTLEDGTKHYQPLKRERTLEGLAAQIFQHEYDHGVGVNIYTKK